MGLAHWVFNLHLCSQCQVTQKKKTSPCLEEGEVGYVSSRLRSGR